MNKYYYSNSLQEDKYYDTVETRDVGNKSEVLALWLGNHSFILTQKLLVVLILLQR